MRISDWSSDVCSSDLAGDSITLTTGSASITMKKDGTITISGKDITIDGSGAINIKDSKNVVIKDRKSVVSGKSVSVRVDLGGRRIIKNKNIPEHDSSYNYRIEKKYT